MHTTSTSLKGGSVTIFTSNKRVKSNDPTPYVVNSIDLGEIRVREPYAGYRNTYSPRPEFGSTPPYNRVLQAFRDWGGSYGIQGLDMAKTWIVYLCHWDGSLTPATMDEKLHASAVLQRLVRMREAQ